MEPVLLHQQAQRPHQRIAGIVADRAHTAGAADTQALPFPAEGYRNAPFPRLDAQLRRRFLNRLQLLRRQAAQSVFRHCSLLPFPCKFGFLSLSGQRFQQAYHTMICTQGQGFPNIFSGILRVFFIPSEN